nr:probable pre-mRNA-splicing factor ATP-dependent RNA helicase DEAH4 isoform X2 [Tanacetum cinerariifolium]
MLTLIKILYGLKSNALLESHTGSGKTLCLLCATLAWRKSLGLASVQIEDVSKKHGKAQTTACRFLCQKRAEEPCDHYPRVPDYVKIHPRLGFEPIDIEDMVKIVKLHGPCPYYLSREIHKSVDILIAPYNYFIDPGNRKSLAIEWEDSVLIFDEAHNPESVCRDAASFDLMHVHRLPYGIETKCKWHHYQYRENNELPLEPSLARTLIEAYKNDCLPQALTVAAMLSVERDIASWAKRKQPPLELPDGSGWGDHIQLLHIYELWAQTDYSTDWVKDNNLQVRGMLFVKNVRKQLCQIMQKFAKGSLDVRRKERRRDRQNDSQNLRKSLCVGYASQLAERMIRHNGYRTVGFKSQLV